MTVAKLFLIRWCTSRRRVSFSRSRSRTSSSARLRSVMSSAMPAMRKGLPPESRIGKARAEIQEIPPSGFRIR